MIRPLLGALFFALLLAGCAPKSPAVPQVEEDLSPFLRNLPAPLEKRTRSRLYADFLQKRYTPWLLTEVNATRESASWAVRRYAKKELYGENRRPLLKKRWRSWIENANYPSLNSLRRHALTVHPSSLRLFPTDRPIFYDPSLAGEGYPFDYNQNSAVKAFTPLIVSHLSYDGGWAFVQTPFALGWLKVRDIAYVSSGQIERIMKMPMVAVLREEAPIYDGSQNFLFYAKISTLLPLAGEEEGFYRVLVPKRGANGSLTLEESLIPVAWAERSPLEMDARNIDLVAGTLLGEPYGWGGIAMDRDCSAMTRDFFAPFGVWLPRNSAQQAKRGRIIDLSGMGDEDKERTIVEKGVPFRTLIHLPGHIMLYVGSIGKKAYVMHNIWGIKTGKNGRYIIGRGVISGLYLGENLPEADKESILIRRIDSMNIVTYTPRAETSTSLPRL